MLSVVQCCMSNELFCCLLISCISFSFWQVPAKQVDNRACSCQLQCFSKVSQNQRKKLFDGFWSSGNFNTQNAYICGCVKLLQVKRWYTNKEIPLAYLGVDLTM